VNFRESTPPAPPTELTQAEQRYLADLGRLPRSHGRRLVGWLLELAPGLGLFAYGLVEDDRTFLILGFLSQLYFAVWRMVAQYRGARMLMSIRRKEALNREART
jgi:hypothetical protein